MCRNIRTLFNFAPPATEDEIRASALQFVRKLSGFNVPSRANADVFNQAVDEVADTARRLLHSLETASLRRATARSRPRRPARGRGSVSSSAERDAPSLAAAVLRRIIAGHVALLHEPAREPVAHEFRAADTAHLLGGVERLRRA